MVKVGVGGGGEGGQSVCGGGKGIAVSMKISVESGVNPGKGNTRLKKGDIHTLE